MKIMKKQLKQIIIYSFLTLGLIGCNNDDFLERYPESQLSPQAYFNNEEELKVYTNGFYSYLPGTDIYMDDLSSDNIVQGSVNQLVAGRRIVPTDAGEAGWTWGQLYNINYFINNYRKAEANEAEDVVNHYGGIAHFFRAFFYFEKVKRFGDVPWYSEPMKEGDEGLFKARDSREFVMDKIMVDLDFAIEHIDGSKNVTRITKWTALALKSRVALFEGTYRKYHSELNLEGGADEYLRRSVQASEKLMNSGEYSIYTTGNPELDYLELFVSEDANETEYILARVYDQEFNVAAPLNDVFTSPTRGTPGITQSLVDSYLTQDGSPISQNPDYPELSFWEETRKRDPRLSQTIRTPHNTPAGADNPLIPDFSNAFTGYQNIKFVTDPGGGPSTNDLPIFRFAEILLNYAEAKAELGEFNQEDADRSINRLRDRVAMPHMEIGNIYPDPFLQNQYNNTNDPVILEIRRERRIELAMEGFRYYDLMRWKEGHLLAETFEGMYFPGTGVYDLDNDGEDDVAIIDNASDRVSGLQNINIVEGMALSKGDSGNLIVHPDLEKVFEDPKDYLYPLPITELLLNENLEQNPGWEQ